MQILQFWGGDTSCPEEGASAEDHLCFFGGFVLCDNITSVAQRCRAVMWNNTSKYANQTYGTSRNKQGLLFLSYKIKRLLGFKCNLNTSEGCNRLRLLQFFLFFLKFVCIRGKQRLLTPVFSLLLPLLLLPSLQPLPAPPPSLPPSAESHYRNTISNTSAQVFDRLQTNLYSGGKQKAAEIYLLSVEERNKLAREPWVTSELTWRWISAPCKCMERRDILHSVIQHIAACRIPLTPTAGTIFLCCKNAVRSCSLRWIIL